VAQANGVLAVVVWADFILAPTDQGLRPSD